MTQSPNVNWPDVLAQHDMHLTDHAMELLQEGENTLAISIRHTWRWGSMRGMYPSVGGAGMALAARLAESKVKGSVRAKNGYDHPFSQAQEIPGMIYVVRLASSSTELAV